jgi:type III pantothenate kinase
VAARSVDYLLVDISNSFTKIAPATRERVGKVSRVETHRLTTAAVRELVRRNKPRAIVFSSVVPKKNVVVSGAAGKLPIESISSKSNLGVSVDYPQPQTIGADRLANAAGVVALFGAPAIVVDFGTAVTFDVVSAKRSYIGGVIAPGLESMTNFLYQRTALLPKLSLREPRSAVGRSTEAAMLSGAVHGYRGLVREIIGQIRREVFPKKRARVFATGGYADLIAGQLPEIEAVYPKLTLEGLRIIGNRTFGLR